MNHIFLEQTQSLPNNKKSKLTTESPSNKQSFQFMFNQEHCLQKQNKHWRKMYTAQNAIQNYPKHKEPGKMKHILKRK